MFKKRSKLLFITILLESIFCIWILFYFNYLDRLTYAQSSVTTTTDLALLVENMYTSTWWALIILTLCLITIFSITSFIYKDVKFHFMSLCLWIVLFILAINIQDSFLNNLSLVAIFIPIFALNIFAYFKQKKLTK